MYCVSTNLIIRFSGLLFHHDLFDHGSRSSSEVQEVDALGHVAAVNLLSAAGLTIGHRLTHAVVKRIAVLGVTLNI